MIPSRNRAEGICPWIMEDDNLLRGVTSYIGALCSLRKLSGKR